MNDTEGAKALEPLKGPELHEAKGTDNRARETLQSWEIFGKSLSMATWNLPTH